MAEIPTRYVDPAQVTAYWQAQASGVPAEWLAAAGDQQSSVTYRASEWLDRQFGTTWKGSRTDPATQIRDWPRDGVVDPQGNPVDSATTPQAVRDSTSIACVLDLQGRLPARQATGQIVDLLSGLLLPTSAPENVSTAALLTAARQALHRLLRTGGIVSLSIEGESHTFSDPEALLRLITALERKVTTETRRRTASRVRRIQS